MRIQWIACDGNRFHIQLFVHSFEQYGSNFASHSGLHDNPWLCDCQISMLTSLSMSLGSPVVLMDQLLMCRRSVGQSGLMLTQAELSRCMRPSVQPAATRVSSPLGSNVILRCDASGYPTPTLTWIKTSAYPGKQSRATFGTEVMPQTSEWLNIKIWFSQTGCCKQDLLQNTEQRPKILESCKLSLVWSINIFSLESVLQFVHCPSL